MLDLHSLTSTGNAVVAVGHGCLCKCRLGHLGADHGGALRDAPQRLAQVPAAAYERHLEVVLIDVVHVVRRRQHLAAHQQELA